MPYVNIKVTREGTEPGATATTPEQKRALIKGVSDLLFDVLGKPHASTFVVIDEVDMENWALAASPCLNIGQSTPSPTRRASPSRRGNRGNRLGLRFPPPCLTRVGRTQIHALAHFRRG